MFRTCAICSFLFLGINFILIVKCQNYDYQEIRKVFLNQFLTLLGNGRHISENKLDSLYSRRSWHRTEKESSGKCINASGRITDGECWLSKCLSPADVYQISGLSVKTTETELCTLSWILFHLSENTACNVTDGQQTSVEFYIRPPSKTEVWGFAVLSATVIVLCAIGGLIALPFIRGVTYHRVLIFMVGLAVGTLAGSSLLVLAPEALELGYEELDSHSYIWKCLVMILAIYTFFLLEKFLRLLTTIKQHRKEKKLHSGHSHGHNKTLEISMSVIAEHEIGNGIANGDKKVDKTEEDKKSHIPSEKEEGKHVAPVAWMILLGDAVHNFIDGVSLGAAFTKSVAAGVSVSVAIVCEELPHELGDFAVLLTAGMSKRRAACFNALAACTIYVGMIVGIFLGENEQAHTWVFAFAAGMFLYIALVNMLPEMIVTAESRENKELIGGGVIFFLQNLGMLVGFGVILTLALFSDRLDKAITSAQL